MTDKNGKRLNKEKAKIAVVGTIAKTLLGGLVRKSTKEPITLADIKDKVQTEMNEYGFSRRSMHDSVLCLMVQWTDEQRKQLHDFCYDELVDGKKK